MLTIPFIRSRVLAATVRPKPPGELLLKILLIKILFTGVLSFNALPASAQLSNHSPRPAKLPGFTFDVVPETFTLTVDKNGVKEQASNPLLPMKVTNLTKTSSRISWVYPERQLSVVIGKTDNYLDITIKSSKKQQLAWPSVQAESYMLPLDEGKYIVARDPSWREFLKGQQYDFLQSFSMGFFALNKTKYAIVYVVKNAFNSEVQFETDPVVQFSFIHNFTSIDKEKSYGFRLYVTDNTPKAVAAVYKRYICEKGRFETLEQKAAKNPNIRKLYGAPQIYFWTHGPISEKNVHWHQFIELWKKDQKVADWTALLLTKYGEADLASEFKQVWQDCKQSATANDYQKAVLVHALNKVLRLKELYNPDVFNDFHVQAKARALSEQEQYAFNKQALKSALMSAIDGPEAWGTSDIDLLDQLYRAGITRAWIGFQDWADGLMNPALVKEANKLGYLVGPYDCYNDIQQTQDRSWDSSWFPDTSLYDNATVSDSSGRKINGFQGRGREFNSTLSMPSVKQRVTNILKDKIPYNSWFVDCDAFGQVFDDYSPDHITTQEQDFNARLARMKYIGDNKGMVVGSEGGNDYASRTMAFAQGLEMTVGRWDDADLRHNKDSPYFVGQYWAPQERIPAIFVKKTLMKPLYRQIYINPANSLPLFRLVYNNSVITTAHWTFGSLKIKNEVGTRMLSELLYNTPPLYHIDEAEWESDKKDIISHVLVWKKFHEKAVILPMTTFDILSKNRLVQRTTFGNKLSVTVNFSENDSLVGKQLVPARSAVIDYGPRKVIYSVRDVVE